MMDELYSYKDIGPKEKLPTHIEFLDLKLYSLTTNIKITGHTKGGSRPMPVRPGSINDHRLRSYLDPHLRPLPLRKVTLTKEGPVRCYHR